MKNYFKLLAAFLLSIVLITCVENHVLPEFGKIFITSDPIGAEIFLNNENTGKVTPDSLFELLSDEYTISLKLNEFIDTTFTTSINENQRQNFDIFLTIFSISIFFIATVYCN